MNNFIFDEIIFRRGSKIYATQTVADDMKRTTVSFEDDHYEILEQWAEREIRTVPNLITAIVVNVLRGEPPAVPQFKASEGQGSDK